MIQGTQSQCSMTTCRDEVGREEGAESRREGTHACLWSTHVDVWQKTITIL